ncbi:MAG: hypothetical protein QOE92_1692 [Chloroflexota bacterium]|jgi:ribosomal protein S18 acetylase RimI-like enzyme|nr:hypothetical protein [Chloroflexota bacterium]
MDTRELRPGDGAALAEAGGLLNRLLGEGMYSDARMAEIAADPEALLLGAWDGGRLAGAAVARLLYPEDADYYHAFGAPALQQFTHHNVGSLEAVAVEPTRQRMGIGKRLTEEKMRWLASQGRDVGVAVSWISGSASGSSPMYQRLGFAGTPPVADFYLEESIKDGWTCPACQGPCHCSASFFYRMTS